MTKSNNEFTHEEGTSSGQRPVKGRWRPHTAKKSRPHKKKISAKKKKNTPIPTKMGFVFEVTPPKEKKSWILDQKRDFGTTTHRFRGGGFFVERGETTHGDGGRRKKKSCLGVAKEKVIRAVYRTLLNLGLSPGSIGETWRYLFNKGNSPWEKYAQTRGRARDRKCKWVKCEIRDK